MSILSDVFSLIGYKHITEHMAYTKLLAYRGCFNHPDYYILDENNRSSPGYQRRSEIASQSIPFWETLNLPKYYPEHAGHLISDEEAKKLLNIQFRSLEEGFIWLSQITDIYFLRKEFEGENIFATTSDINTNRWNHLNTINPALIECVKNLHLTIEERPWPSNEVVKHIVLISSMEKFVKQSIDFIKPFQGTLYFLTGPRGLFNNEESLAYILADWFKLPEKVANIQAVLYQYSQGWTDLQWDRNLSGLKTAILSALQVDTWPEAPQSYYYKNKRIYDNAARQEPFDCMGGPWPVAADMGWYYFKQHLERYGANFKEINFVPIIALGKGQHLAGMDQTINKWFVEYGNELIARGELPLFILSNTMHILPFAISNLSQKNNYQQALLKCELSSKLTQYKENNAPQILDKVRIASPQAQCLSEDLIFDGLAKAIFPLRKNIKKTIDQYQSIDENDYPANLLSKIVHYNKFQDHLSLSNTSVDLASYYSKANDFIKSSGLLNFSINVLKKINPKQPYELINLMHDCSLNNMNRFIKYSQMRLQGPLCQPSFQENDSLLHQDVDNRIKLASIREKLRNKISQTFDFVRLDPSQSFLSYLPQFYRLCFIEMRHYFISIIRQSSALFDIDLNQVAFVYLGSNSRMQATPFSDLEFLILIAHEDEKIKMIVKELTKLILLKVINLGETVLSSLGIRLQDSKGRELNFSKLFYDTYTPDGFSFDQNLLQASKTPLGRKIDGQVIFRLIGTPESLVDNFSSYKGYIINPHFPLSIRSTRFICGSKLLYNEFIDRLEKNQYLNIPAYSQFMFQHDLIRFHDAFDKLSLLPKIAHKKFLTRPIDILLQCLFMSQGQIQSHSTYHLIEKLFAYGLIDYAQTNQLITHLNEVLWLKLYLHLKFKEQKIEISTADPFYKFFMNTQKMLKQVYQHFFHRLAENKIATLKQDVSLANDYHRHLFFRLTVNHRQQLDHSLARSPKSPQLMMIKS